MITTKLGDFINIFSLGFRVAFSMLDYPLAAQR
jgi:hypothetical protein